ncbi:MAG: hypothetical protein JF595_00920 [Sphingomonadales bacterium]|nr:hypothetical protein [Sphingomonadales bacterium]
MSQSAGAIILLRPTRFNGYVASAPANEAVAWGSRSRAFLPKTVRFLPLALEFTAFLG